LLVGYLTQRMGYFDDEVFALRYGLRLFSYWVWLAKEVVRSGIGVARVVLDPRLPISPQVVEIKDTRQLHYADARHADARRAPRCDQST